MKVALKTGYSQFFEDGGIARLLFAGVIESIHDIVFIAYCEDRIVYANPAAQKRFGYSMTELQGKKSDFITSPMNPSYLTRTIYKETVENGFWQGECLNRTKSGDDFPVYLTTAAVRDHNHRMIALTGIAKDTTYLKQTMLSKQISHEIGNPLTALSSLLQVMQHQFQKEKLPPAGTRDFEKYFNKIFVEIERINQLLKQMQSLHYSYNLEEPK
ncbi:MAG: PAS domain S-box protein [Deltaproteobacteria bacterium]|nr:PAS domain S-box protein [Deltaproteobacteria bacterium]